MSVSENIARVRATLPDGVTLVCVSKFHPSSAIEEAYACGERDFGESRVQELLTKQEALPKDIRWHMIGHLQTNKVKQIVPFILLIHSVDSLHLLETINREAERINRVVNVLLEVHVAREETKSGFSEDELQALMSTPSQLQALSHIHICGIMGMATNTDDEMEIRRCFHQLKQIADSYDFGPSAILSMGMSHDYPMAIEEGSTMVRVGTTIFGERIY